MGAVGGETTASTKNGGSAFWSGRPAGRRPARSARRSRRPPGGLGLLESAKVSPLMRTVPSSPTVWAWMTARSGLRAGSSTTSSLAPSKGSGMTTSFLSGRPWAARYSAEPLAGHEVGVEARPGGDERHVQRAGQKAQGHLVVGVVLDGDLAAFDRPAKTHAGRGETAVAAVGHLDAAHATGPDQRVERLAVGVGHEVQAAHAPARHLADERHGVAVDGKAAEGHLGAVGDEARDGLAEAHEPAAVGRRRRRTMGSRPPSLSSRLLLELALAKARDGPRREKPPERRTHLLGARGRRGRLPVGRRSRMQPRHPTASLPWRKGAPPYGRAKRRAGRWPDGRRDAID